MLLNLNKISVLPLLLHEHPPIDRQLTKGVRNGRNPCKYKGFDQTVNFFAPPLTHRDELGRVVIPKEIRRTLRIREGDPLEIYTDRDGEVILKKYSPIGEMSSFAKDYTESLFRSLGHIAVIVDRDQVVAASGLPRKELGDKPISRALETAIASRQTVALNQQSGGRMVAVTTEEDQNPNYTAQVISPIIADGEAIGAVLLMSRDNGVKMGDTELKVAETAAGIVGRQMEQ